MKPTSRKYDLEKRTQLFAISVRKYLKSISINLFVNDDIRQLLRSSGSIAANYIEANESLSKKDFYYRIRICRKESRETLLWLKLLGAPVELTDECLQLMKIFGAIVSRSEK